MFDSNVSGSAPSSLYQIPSGAQVRYVTYSVKVRCPTADIKKNPAGVALPFCSSTVCDFFLLCANSSKFDSGSENILSLSVLHTTKMGIIFMSTATK
ncbi:hypothetical protein E6O75_ATG06298 [Venturia nashicola]|uniref:Uncharacterized protein n=1 Tax=Venturia nashicola TaxID=86259 RepID=A0A4Z1NUF6_9PEZI|nr:hypothetical protein E6O75_ATG06298 [Venturia nashicola]